MSQQTSRCECRTEDLSRAIADGIRAAMGLDTSASPAPNQPKGNQCCFDGGSPRVVVVLCGCAPS